MTKHCRNYRICWQKKIDLSYSNPGGTLENKLNDLIPLLSRKKSFAFQILLTRLNNNHSMRVMYHDLLVWNKPLIDTWQHCSRSRANQLLRLLANAGFQNRGDCLQAFPSFPSPPPSFIFWLSFHFSRGQNRSFFAPKLNGNACYAGYTNANNWYKWGFAWIFLLFKFPWFVPPPHPSWGKPLMSA